MSKKLVALSLVLVLVGGLFAGCGAKETPEVVEEGIKVGMITDTGGLGDQSFNDLAWAGIVKAEADMGIKKSVLQSESANDYLPNLTSFAEEDMDLTIGVGFLFKESMGQAAATFPDANFALVDEVVEADNVASLTFAEHEGSFLVGVAAGLQTESNKIGFIGGMKFPLIEKFEYGFRAGVQSVNPDAEVFVNYAGNFEDSAKGKEIALGQYQQGADVIYHAAGGVGVGLMQAAKENNFWAIGVDKDQSALAPENVLCSMNKKVDNAVYATVKSANEGTFAGGIHTFNIANDGVGYSDEAGNLTVEIKAEMDKWMAAIGDGQFVVPSTEAEFNDFEVPTI